MLCKVTHRTQRRLQIEASSMKVDSYAATIENIVRTGGYLAVGAQW